MKWLARVLARIAPPTLLPEKPDEEREAEQLARQNAVDALRYAATEARRLHHRTLDRVPSIPDLQEG